MLPFGIFKIVCNFFTIYQYSLNLVEMVGLRLRTNLPCQKLKRTSIKNGGCGHLGTRRKIPFLYLLTNYGAGGAQTTKSKSRNSRWWLPPSWFPESWWYLFTIWSILHQTWWKCYDSNLDHICDVDNSTTLEKSTAIFSVTSDWQNGDLCDLE